MIQALLSAIHDVLPDRVFILLPSHDSPDLVFFTSTLKAVVKVEDPTPTFMVFQRSSGQTVTSGAAPTAAEATAQAIQALHDEAPEARYPRAA